MDSDMPVPPEGDRGKIGKFFFQSYLNFISFYIYHLFMCTRVSENYVSVMYRCGTSASN
jgi:hypothetical protein